MADARSILALVAANAATLEPLQHVLVDYFPAVSCATNEWALVVIVRYLPFLPVPYVPPEYLEDGTSRCRVAVIDQSVYGQIYDAQRSGDFGAGPPPEEAGDWPVLGPQVRKAARKLFRAATNATPAWRGVVAVRASPTRTLDREDGRRVAERCVVVTVKAKGWRCWGEPEISAVITHKGVSVRTDVVEGQFAFESPRTTDHAETCSVLSVGATVERVPWSPPGCAGKGTLAFCARRADAVGMVTAGHVAVGDAWDPRLHETATSSVVYLHPTRRSRRDACDPGYMVASGTLGGTISVLFPSAGGAATGDAAFVPLLEGKEHSMALCAPREALVADYERQMNMKHTDYEGDDLRDVPPFSLPCFCQAPRRPDRNEPVFKVGAATGLTAGRYRGMCSIIADAPRAPPVFSDPSTAEGARVRFPSMGAIEPNQRAFSNRRDSGALVWSYGVGGASAEPAPAVPLGVLCGKLEERDVAWSVFSYLDACLQELRVEMILPQGCPHVKLVSSLALSPRLARKRGESHG